jgi:hypothetical protein
VCVGRLVRAPEFEPSGGGLEGFVVVVAHQLTHHHDHREISNWTGFFCRKGFGGSGGTRNDFVAENGFKTCKGSNLIGFELLLTMIAVSNNSLMAPMRHVIVVC